MSIIAPLFKPFYQYFLLFILNFYFLLTFRKKYDILLKRQYYVATGKFMAKPNTISTKKANRPQYLLKDYTNINPNFSVNRKIIHPGFQELHTHNYFEIELIIKGCGLQVLNGVPYEIKKGNFTFLTPTDFHELHFKDDTEIINISFAPSILSQNILNSFINNNTNQTYYLSETEYNTFYALMTAIINEYADSLSYRDSSILNLLNYIVIFFQRKLNKQHPETHTQAPIDIAISYIATHFKESPSLNEVATYVHFNPCYFSQLFKKATGTTYNNYLNKLKVKQAKFLLSQTDNSIIQIGFLCGFNSSSNFYLEFGKHTGMTPTQYRNSIIKNQNE